MKAKGIYLTKLGLFLIVALAILAGALWGRSSLSRVEYQEKIVTVQAEPEILVVPDVPATVTKTVAVPKQVSADCVTYQKLVTDLIAATDGMSPVQGSYDGIASRLQKNINEQDPLANIQIGDDLRDIDDSMMQYWRVIGENTYKIQQLEGACN